MLIKFPIATLIKNKDFGNLRRFVDLGFEFSLTEFNSDTLTKFGDAENIIYNLIMSNDLEKIKRQPKKLLNVANNNGYTPLHWAIVANRNDIIDYIISECSNHLAETIFGENCFSLAARYDNTYAFEKLMALFHHRSVMLSNERGFNALIFAAACKNILILESIIKNSDKVMIRSHNNYDANFLHWLFHGKNCSDHNKALVIKTIFKLLHEKTSKHDIKKMLREANVIGYTPITWLEHYDNQETIKFLQEIYK